jgi:hypothetical protein
LEISLQVTKATVAKGLTALARREVTKRKMRMMEVNQKKSILHLCPHRHLPPENQALFRLNEIYQECQIPFPLARLKFCAFTCKLY